MFLLHTSTFATDLAILLALCFALSGAIACFVWVVRNSKRRVRSAFVGFLGSLGFLGFLLVAYGSFIEPHILVTTKHNVALPVSQSLRIAVISDIHIGPYKGRRHVQRIVDSVNRSLPDLVLFVGDFIYTPEADIRDLAPLVQLHAPLGIFAVLGNHDIGQYRNIFGQKIQKENRGDKIAAALEAANISVLRNENEVITLNEGSIAIAGIDDLWLGESDLQAALADIPEGTPTILLSHNPSIILDPESHDAHLILSGHTHGGQIRLPFIGPLANLPTDLGQGYDQGPFKVDEDTTLTITRGAGESTARARLFAWPEIMVLTTEASTL